MQRGAPVVPGSVVARSVLVLVLVAVSLVAFCAVAPPAVAGTVTSWYGVQPTGAVGANVPIIISGGATTDGFLMDASTIKLFIDGALYPRDRYYASSRSGTGLYLSCAPAPALTDGTHTFRVEISDTSGKLSAYQWSALVRQAPVAAWVSPAAGSSYYGGRPPITMNVTDNTPGAHLAVAGQVRTGSATGAVVSTFGGTGLASGVHTFSLPAELAPGTYYLTATATDASGYARALTGKLARSFKTISLPAMTRLPQTCLSAGCHVTTGHPTTGRTCLACHVTGYHEDYECNECHAPHAAPVTVTGRFGPCTACHNPSYPDVPGHTSANVTPAHMSSCEGCHTESLLDRHAITPEGSAYPYQCDVCHGSTDPAVVAAIAAGDASCGACHDREVSHGDLTAIHQATVTGGPVQALSNHYGAGPRSTSDIPCSGCHASANLLNAHGDGTSSCAMCHQGGGPRSTFDTWNRGCQQGACHPTLHDNAVSDASHPPAVSGDCSYCHAGQGSGIDFNAPMECTVVCHRAKVPAVGDALAPVTTVANAAAYFKDPAAVQLTASDAGSNVTGIYYRIDGGEWAFCPGAVTTANVPAGAGGLLEFYSVDWFGNREAVKSYAVTFDLAAPATLVSETYPSGSPYRLTASDVGSGVATMYFSIDGEPFRVYGYFENIDGIRTDGGGGTHSVRYYSVDKVGNVETTTTVTWVIPDSTAPTSTLGRTDGDSAYIESVDAYGDNPCGVKEIRYRLDGGDWAVASFPRERPYFAMPRRVDVVAPVDGSYQLEYYAVDWVDNAEAPRTTTLVIDGVAPVLTMTAADTYTGSSSIPVSATDVGSGVASISYQINSYPVVNRTGSSATIGLTAPPTGSTTYTLRVWATDNAGNTSQIFGPKTIVVYPPPDVTAPVTNLQRLQPPATRLNVTYSGQSFNSGTLFNLRSDDPSGLARIEYRIDGGELQTVTGSAATYLWVDLAVGAGVHTITFNAVDRVGNVESPKTIGFTVLPEFMTLLFEMSNTGLPGVTWESSNYTYDVWVRRGATLVNETTNLQTVDSWSGTPIQYKGFSFWDLGDGPYTVEMVLHTHSSGDQTYTWTDVALADGETLTLEGTYSDATP